MTLTDEMRKETSSNAECIHVWNKNWIYECKLNVDNKYFFCISTRPQGKSYLFFTEFKAELKGTKIEYANAYVSMREKLNMGNL